MRFCESTSHSFNVTLARFIGLKSAIFLNYIQSSYHSTSVDIGEQYTFAYEEVRHTLDYLFKSKTDGDLDNIISDLIELEVIKLSDCNVNDATITMIVIEDNEETAQLDEVEPPSEFQTLNLDWFPSRQLIDTLVNNSRITESFIEEEIHYFRLYYNNKPMQSPNWDFIFSAWVRKNWVRKQSNGQTSIADLDLFDDND